MIKVFTAQNSIEANIVKGMLEANGIPAYIPGEYLQGGIGELPAIDMIFVSVNESDKAKAEKLIHYYETGQDMIEV